MSPLRSQLCDISGQCFAVHLAAVNEYLMMSIVDRVSAACGIKLFDLLDVLVSPSADHHGESGLTCVILWRAMKPAMPQLYEKYTIHDVPRALLYSTTSETLTWECYETFDIFCWIV